MPATHKPHPAPHWRPLSHDDAGVRGVDPCQLGQAQCEHLSTGDTALVLDAGKLPQGECAVFIKHGALGAHAPHGGSFSLQVLEVVCGLFAQLNGARGRHHFFETAQR